MGLKHCHRIEDAIEESSGHIVSLRVVFVVVAVVVGNVESLS